MTYPPRFDLDKVQIMNLLTGDRFYESVDAALREAVLNAIDACGRRAAAEGEYAKRIEVVFNQSNKTVTIEDNGDGMNENDVSELFAKVGASASRAFKDASAGKYVSVGEFGIGIVSYFLVCDKFQLQTKKGDGPAMGLQFSRDMFDMEKQAEIIAATRTSTGTTVTFLVTKDTHFTRMLERFSHWVRDVPYLAARTLPEDKPLLQGGRRAHVRPVKLEKLPEWVEVAEVGPPIKLDVWKTLDGIAHIDVLYRGIYVQPLDIPHLWGIEGSLHVNPKKFMPKLNRESFISEGFVPEVTAFLQSVHPLVLREALANFKEAIQAGEAEGWGLTKWLSFWLAVPRSGNYAEVAKAWDDEFRQIKAFKLLGESSERHISLVDLLALAPTEIYVVPLNLDSQTPLVKKAVSILRARGSVVIQGLSRDGSFMGGASYSYASSSDLLLNQLRAGLPPIHQVEGVAESLLHEHAKVAELFVTSPRVVLVKLGAGAAPVVRVGSDFWINVESENGKKIVLETCDRNEGYLGLLSACQTHAPDHLSELVPLLRSTKHLAQRLGPVRRQFVRGKLA